MTKHWTGPFIIKRQTSEVDYLIKEEEGRKSFIVHHNRLKICTTSADQGSSDIPCSPTETNEQEKQEDSVESQPWNTDDLIAIVPTDSGESTPQPRRSQRSRQPPNRFGNNVYDYDDLIP